MSDKLSTAVYKMMEGVESWDQADADVRTAFYRQMKGKAYGFDPLLDAWHWFYFGWKARFSPGARVEPETGNGVRFPDVSPAYVDRGSGSGGLLPPAGILDRAIDFIWSKVSSASERDEMDPVVNGLRALKSSGEPSANPGVKCVPHATEYQVQDRLPCPWCVIHELRETNLRLRERAGFHKADRGYEISVLRAVQDVRISVGKAGELLRDYIHYGTEGALPESSGEPEDVLWPCECCHKPYPDHHPDCRRDLYGPHRFVDQSEFDDPSCHECGFERAHPIHSSVPTKVGEHG